MTTTTTTTRTAKIYKVTDCLARLDDGIYKRVTWWTFDRPISDELRKVEEYTAVIPEGYEVAENYYGRKELFSDACTYSMTLCPGRDNPSTEDSKRVYFSNSDLYRPWLKPLKVTKLEEA